MYGVFTDNGPFVFDDGEDVLKPNVHAWTARANMLYIDNPTHAGFSIGDPNEWNYTDLSVSIDLLAAV